MNIKDFFKHNKNVTVAVSGGVDSAVLLLLAKKYAESVYACFVKSEFQPQFELDDARAVCKAVDIPIKIIELSVLKVNTICSNPSNRCYYCKKLIFNEICYFAKSKNSIVIEGTNADDNVNERAGFKAINELGVLSPLRLCGFTKNDIRKIARENGIPVFDKPSYACLATRIPTNTYITGDIINKTEKAEGELFRLNFSNFRIRYNNGCALLEFTESDRNTYLSAKEKIDKILCEYYSDVQLSDKVRV